MALKTKAVKAKALLPKTVSVEFHHPALPAHLDNLDVSASIRLPEEKFNALFERLDGSLCITQPPMSIRLPLKMFHPHIVANVRKAVLDAVKKEAGNGY